MKRLPKAVAAAGILSGVVGQLVSSLHLSGWPARALLTVGVLAGIADQTWERVIHPRREDTERLRQLLALWPPPMVSKVSPYDVGVFRSEIAEAMSGSEEPPYVGRGVDPQLHAALGRGAFVLVAGPSKSGKSRTAFEAVRSRLGHASLIVPIRPFRAGGARPLAELAEGPPLRELRDRLIVVWLDDVDGQLRSGELTAPVLRRLRETYPGAVVVATLRYGQLEQLETDAEVARNVREVLSTATCRIHLQRDLKGDELASARAIYPELDTRSALGEYLTATDLLVERYRRGCEVDPGGAAVVRATVDWERTGALRPISRDELRLLASRRLTALRANLAFNDESFGVAVSWGCEAVVSTAALLSELDEGYKAFDYVVDWISANEDEVDTATWAYVIAQRAEDEGLAIGMSAYGAGQRDVAGDAWAAAARTGNDHVRPRTVDH